jgi:hypothetical protein
MPNIIEEQAIVVYVASPFQGISWKVHFEFVYGHIKTHPYSPCKNKDGFFLVNFFCSDIWTFLIKCFSHNIILSWFLVHNTFILFYLRLWFSAILSYCWHYGGWPKCNTFISCTKFCTSKVLPPIQDESGDVSEWAHKSSRWFCKVDACTSSYAAKWLLCQHLGQTHSFQMQAGKSRHPSTHPRGLGNKIMVLWMFIFWTTLACKAKVECDKGPWSSKKENGIRVGWTSSLSTTNAIG